MLSKDLKTHKIKVTLKIHKIKLKVKFPSNVIIMFKVTIF